MEVGIGSMIGGGGGVDFVFLFFNCLFIFCWDFEFLLIVYIGSWEIVYICMVGGGVGIFVGFWFNGCIFFVNWCLLVGFCVFLIFLIFCLVVLFEWLICCGDWMGDGWVSGDFWLGVYVLCFGGEMVVGGGEVVMWDVDEGGMCLGWFVKLIMM